MANDPINKNLGTVTAYGYAKSKGYTGTEEEFAELMADYATVGQQAAASAQEAAASAQGAQAAKDDAESAATASQAAGSAAASSASAAATAAQAAYSYATAASTAQQGAAAAQEAAVSAKGAAEQAATAAGTAKDAAEAAQQSAEDAKVGAAQAASSAASSAELAEDAAEKISPAKYVSPSGDDSNDGNTPQSAYASLSKALSTGVENIFVARGTYTEMNPNSETWNPRYTNAAVNIVADSVLLITTTALYFRYAREVQISGLHISIDPAAPDNASGMLLLNCSAARLFACEVSGAPYMGYRLDGTKAVLENCVAHDCGIDGINAHRVADGYEPDITLVNCSAYNNGDDGASVHEHGKMTVIGGEYYNNGQAGIAAANFCTFSFRDVSCHNNGRSGIEAINDSLGGSAPAVGSIENCWIHNNPFGVSVKNYNVRVAGNAFERNANADVQTSEGATVSSQGYSIETLSVYPTDTASGNPAAITDGAEGLPVKSLSVQITPVQSGSGDPAPDNVRQISGRTGLQLYVSPTADVQDGDTYALSWESEAGTVYGGTLDVTTGLLTVNRGKKVFDGSENGWTINSSYGVAYDIRGIGSGIDLTQLPVADYLTTLPQGAGSGLAAWQCRYNPSGAYFLARGDAAVTASVAAWKAYLAEHPLTVLFGLSSPFTYQIAPNAVRTLLGVNKIWSDAGEVSLIYRADVGLYINKKLGVSV